MKAIDLMIGDWVLALYNKVYYPCKVVAVFPTEVHVKEKTMVILTKYDEWGEVKPIPLTAEILEKNGFKVGHYLVGLTKKPEYKMVNRNELKNVEKNVITIRQSSDVLFDMQVGIGSHIFDITYVHELQHALRLCGIEKEINL